MISWFSWDPLDRTSESLDIFTVGSLAGCWWSPAPVDIQLPDVPGWSVMMQLSVTTRYEAMIIEALKPCTSSIVRNRSASTRARPASKAWIWRPVLITCVAVKLVPTKYYSTYCTLCSSLHTYDIYTAQAPAGRVLFNRRSSFASSIG
jgi:hypothetical protein